MAAAGWRGRARKARMKKRAKAEAERTYCKVCGNEYLGLAYDHPKGEACYNCASHYSDDDE